MIRFKQRKVIEQICFCFNFREDEECSEEFNLKPTGKFNATHKVGSPNLCYFYQGKCDLNFK